jgi:hypothetical protein
MQQTRRTVDGHNTQARTSKLSCILACIRRQTYAYATRGSVSCCIHVSTPHKQCKLHCRCCRWLHRCCWIRGRAGHGRTTACKWVQCSFCAVYCDMSCRCCCCYCCDAICVTSEAIKICCCYCCGLWCCCCHGAAAATVLLLLLLLLCCCCCCHCAAAAWPCDGMPVAGEMHR